MITCFDSKAFLKSYKKIFAQKEQAVKAAEAVLERNPSKIYFLGSGGAYTKYYSVAKYLEQKLKVPFSIDFPQEFSLMNVKSLREEDVIVLGTKTGSTDEILSVAQSLKERPNLVVGFIGDEETPLDSMVHHKIRSYITDVHIVLLWIFAMTLTGDSRRNDFVKEMEDFGEILADTLSEKSKDANDHVDYQLKQNYQMWVTSGNLFGEIRCYCNYMLEEIQWLKAQAIHSGEYFHGPLELVDKGICINVVLNRGATRDMDQRVKNFCEKYGTSLWITDLQDFKLHGISEEFKEMIDPYVLNMYFDYLLDIYASRTNRTAQTRQFYRKVPY